MAGFGSRGLLREWLMSPENSVNWDILTLNDLYNMAEMKWMYAIINDGRIEGFEYDRS